MTAAITTDKTVVSQWMAEQVGTGILMPCLGAVGQVIGGRMVAGLIWWGRDERSVSLAMHVLAPTRGFRDAALQAIFTDAPEAHFMAHIDNVRLHSLACKLGAVRLDDDRSGREWTHYVLRQKD